jgi:hypothetical protein
MNAFDSQLANRLHDMVDDEPDSAPSTQILLQRWQGRRARRRRVVAVVGASFAVLTLGAITAVAVTPSSTPNRPNVEAEASSPRLELASAITATENISYQVKVTSGSKDNPGNLDITEGAFDPETATGYLNSPYPGGVYYERLVDGVRFVGATGAGWKQYPGKHNRLAYDRVLNGALGATADPGQLLQVLKSKGSITQTAPNTYQFKVTSDEHTALTGEVTVDTSNRVERITYERTTTVTKDGKSATSHDQVTLALSAYGTPVKVQRPTDAVIVK